MAYTIYHIPGIKIGCSSEPENRVSKQGFTDYEVLEVHEDIYVASDREIELQKQYGYRVDNIPYYKSYNRLLMAGTFETRSTGGRNGGNTNIESGHLESLRTKNHQSNAGKASVSKLRICPHCGSHGRGIGYNRNHGNNCKKKGLLD